jgi:hypothetical protein
MVFGRNMPKRSKRDALRGKVFAIQLPEERMRAADSWANDHGVSRSEAVADLLGQSLALGRPMPKDRRAKAAELAAKEIDKLSNPSAPDEERQKRKRRLLEGPRELRNMRR